MSTLEELRQSLPEYARDIKLNIDNVLKESTLSESQRYGVAIAAAASSRNKELLLAIVDEAKQKSVPAGIIEDALFAATIMGMNNIYYRARHFTGSPRYEDKSPKFRMNRMMKPAGSKLDLELFSLASSAITGCEICVKAHEKVATGGSEHKLTEDQVHDGIRIASVIHGMAIALELTKL